MKKFIVFLLILALLLAVAYQVYFTIELTPNITDLEAAKTNLKNAGYDVMHFKVGDGVLVESNGRLEYLIANESSIGSTNNSNMLNIQVFEDEELAKIYYRENKNNVQYLINQYENYIDLYEYQLANNEDLTEKEIDDYLKEIEDLQETVNYYKSHIIGRSGAVVWIGTKGAIEISRG